MTSNLGVKEFADQAKMGFAISEKENTVNFNDIQNHVLGEVKKSFRPEFLNRLDHVVVFKPLNEKSIHKIVKLQLNELKERLKEKKITLKVGPKIQEFITKQSFEPESGARPIRRTIQKLIEDPLAEKILEGEFVSGDTVAVRKVKTGINLKKLKKSR